MKKAKNKNQNLRKKGNKNDTSSKINSGMSNRTNNYNKNQQTLPII